MSSRPTYCFSYFVISKLWLPNILLNLCRKFVRIMFCFLLYTSRRRYIAEHIGHGIRKVFLIREEYFRTFLP